MRKIVVCLFVLLMATQIMAQRKMEKLDRGLIAYKVGNGIMITWRVLGEEWDGVTYNLYREEVKINNEPITGATNYMDMQGVPGTNYTVSAIIDGVEQAKCKSVAALAQSYFDIPLDLPSGGVTPIGGSYTYSPNDCSTGDLDGDGQYEIIVKYDPSNSKDNSQSGYTGNVYLDAYQLDGTKLWRIDLGKNIRAGAHYTQFMVFDFDGDGKAEVSCKTADGTIDGVGKVIGNAAADYRTSSGYVLSGPEFLTMFNGETGAAMATVNYVPARGTVSSWGDSYGNRVDRFLAAVAYLDGQKPSLIMCRGYYTRTVLAAWDWDGSKLTSRWVFDSNNSGYANYTGQGNHNLSVADADFDGKDEIMYGSCAIDDNGKGLYTTGLGHGDAIHVSDFDPSRPGLEVFAPHETGNNGVSFRDAATGAIIWQKKKAGDIGRGLCADISAEYKGAESWGSSYLGVYNAKGDVISSSFPSINFAIWWDGDDLRELLNSNSISKWGVGTQLSASGCLSINGTKSNPNLSADLLGDWREEVIFRTDDNRNLRLFLTPYTTNRRLYTLMHDSQYRLSIAWQNVAYNQPPHTSFFFGNGMATPPPPKIAGNELVWNQGSQWDINQSENWRTGELPSVFKTNDHVRFDLTSNVSSPIQLIGNIQPGSVMVNNPTDITFNGSGTLSGAMNLEKDGKGQLTIDGDLTYSGSTSIWQGALIVNGRLENSAVLAQSMAIVGGNGEFGNGLTIENNASLFIGQKSNEAASLQVNKQLVLNEAANITFDLSDDHTGLIKKNDHLVVNGDLFIYGENSLVFNLSDQILSPGNYELITFTGNFSGDLSKLICKGLLGIPFELKVVGKSIIMSVIQIRPPETLVWDGASSPKWNLADNKNWKIENVFDWFVSNDTVIFNDQGNATDIIIDGSLAIGKMVVDATKNYQFAGTGSISGKGGIIKSGTGRLTIGTNNLYTGATIVNQGILKISNLSNAEIPGALGSSSADASNLVINGATLQFSGENSETDRGMTIGANGAEIQIDNTATSLTFHGSLTGSGNLVKSGDGTLSLFAKNNYTGETIIKAGKIYLGSSNAIASGLGSCNVTIENGTLSFLNNLNSYDDNRNNLIIPQGKIANIELDGRCNYFGSLTGGGTLNLLTPFVRSELNGDWSEFTGNINVSSDSDGGTFLIGNSKGMGKSVVSLDNNVTMIYRQNETTTIEIGELAGTTDAVLGSGGDGTANIAWKIGGKNTHSIYNGIINNVQYSGLGASASIIKTGTGRLTLTGDNTYSGGTIVEGGNLMVFNISGSATGTGSVVIKSKSLISGNGIIAGPLEVEESGGVSPGDANIGKLTVNNSVIFKDKALLSIKCSALNKQADMLKSTGQITLGGILFIANISAVDFAAGMQFRLFEAPEINGAFSTIVPAVPGNNLIWDTSDLNSQGIIKIAVSTGTQTVAGNSSIHLFPNPVVSKLTVSRVVPFYKAAVRLYNMSGKLCLQWNQLQGTSISLDLKGLKKGIYCLMIIDDHENFTAKVVKQ